MKMAPLRQVFFSFNESLISNEFHTFQKLEGHTINEFGTFRKLATVVNVPNSPFVKNKNKKIIFYFYGIVGICSMILIRDLSF